MSSQPLHRAPGSMSSDTSPKAETEDVSKEEGKTIADVEVDTSTPSAEQAALDQPPDGGLHAWMTVAATWLISFMSFGIATFWGVFQDAYTANANSRFHNVGLFRLGFVGGCGMGFGFSVGPFSNIIITKFGVHASILLGVILISVAFELASISTQYWQLLLSQGIMFGIGISFCWIPAISLPSQWFAKRRSLATGIASSGTGISAVVLSPVVQVIIDRASIPWALRFIGFLTFACGLAGVALVRQRPVAKKFVQYKVFDLSVLKVPGYPLYLVFCFMQFFGYVTPLFFIPSYCTAIGLSATKASGVLSVTTACNSIGRIIAGQMADLVGPINVLIVFHIMTGLMCIFIWLFAKSLGVIMVFAILWGLWSGPYWPLSVPTAAKIVGMEKLGSAAAIQFLMNVIPPIFAVPIGSKIISDTAASMGVSADSGDAYRYLIVWCALMPIASALVLVPVRLVFSKRLLAKV
ncbi:major facilitator superfamily domain-containing protein [Sparassis latifolia]|uniref:MFS general substrate transporter n=1 Tax=Sparassis crispa TaxID=139825 RepID=A0A401H4Y0_9APHY|nr:MFS general substrate transporter [Sparassis crispa]GBE89506.1 MFS general substrate transporter [Sparassis crispa]